MGLSISVKFYKFSNRSNSFQDVILNAATQSQSEPGNNRNGSLPKALEREYQERMILVENQQQ